MTVAAGVAAIYYTIIKPKMIEFSQTIGKAETVAAAPAGWPTFLAKLEGWYTQILAAIVIGVQAISLTFQSLDADIIKEWQALPWASLFDQSLANRISLFFTFLIPVTHVIAISKAAKTTPKA
jgi:hypothetical protein